jgi:hypothetical protein
MAEALIKSGVTLNRASSEAPATAIPIAFETSEGVCCSPPGLQSNRPKCINWDLITKWQ